MSSHQETTLTATSSSVPARRVVAITGAAQGLGRAYALRFAREGHAVVALDIKTEAWSRVADIPPDATHAGFATRIVRLGDKLVIGGTAGLFMTSADDGRSWTDCLVGGKPLSGNLTLLGSVANLIVAEIARRRGVHLGFVEYLKAGTPIAVLTLLLGVAWLAWI